MCKKMSYMARWTEISSVMLHPRFRHAVQVTGALYYKINIFNSANICQAIIKWDFWAVLNTKPDGGLAAPDQLKTELTVLRRRSSWISERKHVMEWKERQG